MNGKKIHIKLGKWKRLLNNDFIELKNKSKETQLILMREFLFNFKDLNFRIISF